MGTEDGNHSLAILDDLPTPTWATDVDGLCCYFNKAWLEFAGTTMEEELGNGWEGRVHPDDVDRVRESFRKAFAARAPFDLEFRVRRRDGNYRWFQDAGRPRIAPDGRFVGYIGSGFDITERRETHETVVARASHLRLALEAAKDGFWDINLAESSVHLSPQIYAMLGYARGELVPTLDNWECLVHPDDIAEAYEAAVRCETGGWKGGYSADIRCRTKTGGWKWMAVRCQVAKMDPEGRPLRVVGVLRDISHRKETERHSQYLVRELAILNAVYKGLLDQPDQSDFWGTLAGVIEAVLPAPSGTVIPAAPGIGDRNVIEWGLSCSRIQCPLKMTAGPLNRLRPRSDESIHVVECDKASIESGRPSGDAMRAEPSLCADMPIFFRRSLVARALLRWRTPFDDMEICKRFLTILAQQIGVLYHNNQLYRQLHGMSARLLAAQEEERRSIARELHDEIGGILTGLSFALDLPGLSGTAGPGDGLDAARSLAMELHDRVHALTLDLRPPTLDDLGLVPAIESCARRSASLAGVDVHFRKRGRVARLKADLEIALYRVVQEALTNAIRHSGARQVWVSAVGDDRRITIGVRDNGKGFDVESVTATHSRNGLAGMRERAALIGARLTITSKAGVGTTAKITLDLGREESVACYEYS